MKVVNLKNCHGEKFKARINGSKIGTGVISVSNDKVYLCQDFMSGSRPKERFGYGYGWVLNGHWPDLYTDMVDDFELIEHATRLLVKQLPIDTIISNKDESLKVKEYSNKVFTLEDDEGELVEYSLSQLNKEKFKLEK